MMKRSRVIVWLSISVAVVAAIAIGSILMLPRFFEKQWFELSSEEQEAFFRSESERFDSLLAEAPDEELFLVLRYALYYDYVPTGDIDPYENISCSLGRWYRTVAVFERLENRKDLLTQIYPDFRDLEMYVHACGVGGNERPYDSIRNAKIEAMHDQIHQTIDSDAELFETMDAEKNGLRAKYYSIPKLRR